jgi:hypothetical protein
MAYFYLRSGIDFHYNIRYDFENLYDSMTFLNLRGHEKLLFEMVKFIGFTFNLFEYIYYFHIFETSIKCPRS